MKKCIECNGEIEGRIDKIFCSPYCKSSFHLKKNRGKGKSLYSQKMGAENGRGKFFADLHHGHLFNKWA